jgi:hypothetical protein
MASQSVIRSKFSSYPCEPIPQGNHVFSLKVLLSEVGTRFYSYRCGGNSYYMFT